MRLPPLQSRVTGIIHLQGQDSRHTHILKVSWQRQPTLGLKSVTVKPAWWYVCRIGVGFPSRVITFTDWWRVFFMQLKSFQFTLDLFKHTMYILALTLRFVARMTKLFKATFLWELHETQNEILRTKRGMLSLRRTQPSEKHANAVNTARF